MMNIDKGMRALTLLVVMMMTGALKAGAQIRLNQGGDSPLRKLQVAEMAITYL